MELLTKTMFNNHTLTEPELLERIKSLPDEIQKLLLATETNELIREIAKNNGVTEFDTLTLRQVVALTLLGFNPPASLASKINSELKVSKGEVIAGQIQRKVLDPVKSELAKIYPIATPLSGAIPTPVKTATSPPAQPVRLSAVSIDDIRSVPERASSNLISGTIPTPAPIAPMHASSEAKPVMLHQESTYRPVTLSPDVSLKMRGQSNASSSGSNDLFRSDTPVRKTDGKMIAEIEFGKMSGDSDTGLKNKIPAFSSGNLTPFKPTHTPVTAPVRPALPPEETPAPQVTPTMSAPLPADKALAPKDSWDIPSTGLPLPPPVAKPNSLLSPLFKRVAPPPPAVTPNISEIPLPPPPAKY